MEEVYFLQFILIYTLLQSDLQNSGSILNNNCVAPYLQNGTPTMVIFGDSCKPKMLQMIGARLNHPKTCLNVDKNSLIA